MVCKGSEAQVKAELSDLEDLNLITVAILTGIQATSALIATIYIFVTRPWKSIPTFVKVQMAFLNCFWMCLGSYSIIVINQLDGDGK